MRRTNIARATVVAAIAAAAAFIGWGAPATPTVEAQTPGANVGMELLIQDQASAWVSITSSDATVGQPCEVFVDGVPVGATVLMPGPNVLNVPASVVGSYSAIGPEFECAVVSDRNWDPGDL